MFVSYLKMFQELAILILLSCIGRTVTYLLYEDLLLQEDHVV